MDSRNSPKSSSRIATLLDRLVGPQQHADMKNPTGPSVAPATAEVPPQPPPTYSEATASSPDIDASQQSRDAELDDTDSASTPDGRPKPPSDAQLARAPLRIETTNFRISGCYLVTNSSKDGCGSSDKPDVFLKTTNAKIDAAIWADDSDWNGPFSVRVESTNGRIAAPVVRRSQQSAWY